MFKKLKAAWQEASRQIEEEDTLKRMAVTAFMQAQIDAEVKRRVKHLEIQKEKAEIEADLKLFGSKNGYEVTSEDMAGYIRAKARKQKLLQLTGEI